MKKREETIQDVVYIPTEGRGNDGPFDYLTRVKWRLKEGWKVVSVTPNRHGFLVVVQKEVDESSEEEVDESSEDK